VSDHLQFSAIFAAPFGEQLWAGLQVTLWITCASWLLAMSVGTFLAIMRMSGSGACGKVVTAYVAYHQNVPMLVHILLWYFGIASLLPTGIQAWANEHHGEQIFAVMAIGLYMAAYFSEDIRSGLRSIPSGQYEASRSLGLGYLKSMRYVILPQTFRIAMPPFINHTVLLFKNTSLAMAIGVAELTYTVREIENQTYRTFEAFFIATMFYVLVCLVLMVVGAITAHMTRIPTTSK